HITHHCLGYVPSLCRAEICFIVNRILRIAGSRSHSNRKISFAILVRSVSDCTHTRSLTNVASFLRSHRQSHKVGKHLNQIVFRVMKNLLLRALVFVAAVLLSGIAVGAQASNAPVLAMTPDDNVSNQWNVTVVNPVVGHAYRIERRKSLNDTNGWQ